MKCTICKTSNHQIAIKSKMICKSCEKKEWQVRRLPELIKSGFYGYCNLCNNPKKLHQALFCSFKGDH